MTGESNVRAIKFHEMAARTQSLLAGIGDPVKARLTHQIVFAATRLAEWWERNASPLVLNGITTRTQIVALLECEHWPDDPANQKRLRTAHINADSFEFARTTLIDASHDDLAHFDQQMAEMQEQIARASADDAWVMPAWFQQYDQIKRDYPDHLVLFQIGTLYELFDQDAAKAAPVLDLVAFSRRSILGGKMMLRLNGSQLEEYQIKLLASGYPLVIVEQIGNEPIQGVIPRQVTKVLSPHVPPVTVPPPVEIPEEKPAEEPAAEGEEMEVAFANERVIVMKPVEEPPQVQDIKQQILSALLPHEDGLTREHLVAFLGQAIGDAPFITAVASLLAHGDVTDVGDDHRLTLTRRGLTKAKQLLEPAAPEASTDAEAAAEAAEEQPTPIVLPGLIPAKPPMYRTGSIRLDMLPSNEDLLKLTAMPDVAFLADIKFFGVRVPIECRWDGLGKSIPVEAILAGRKRIIAARAAGFKMIPCRYAPDLNEEQGLAIMATDNLHRKENPLTDLYAIERLIEKYAPLVAPGATADQIDDLPRSLIYQIARDLHLPIGTVKKRLKLRRLLPELRAAMVNGDLAESVAYAVAALPKPDQAKLVDTLTEVGRITGQDVRDVRQVQIRREVDLWGEIDTPGAEEVQTSAPTNHAHRTVLELIDHALQDRTTDPWWVLVQVRAALSAEV